MKLKGQHASLRLAGDPPTQLAPEEAPAAALSKLNIESKLKNTRNLLQELGKSVSSLVNSSPDIFNDPVIKSYIKEFLAVYQEAVWRLENPSFRIATIGTTSSRKSTIVNAIIGRKIAPIEAGKMSGVY